MEGCLMSETYDYSKASINVPRLTLEIEADETIEKTLDGISHNVGETPNDLHITFSEALTAGEITALDGIVVVHTGTALTVFNYFCYCCGTNYTEPSILEPTQCQHCSSTDIQSQFHKSNLIATTNPGVGNDDTEGYCIGSQWINVDTDEVFKCMDVTTGAAVWKSLTRLKVVRQDTEPTLTVDDDNIIWYDTSENDQAWIIFRVTVGDQRKVEMT